MERVRRRRANQANGLYQNQSGSGKTPAVETLWARRSRHEQIERESLPGTDGLREIIGAPFNTLGTPKHHISDRKG